VLASFTGHAGSFESSLPWSQVWIAVTSIVVGALPVSCTGGSAVAGPTPYSPTTVDGDELGILHHRAA
jgi:hypothetical protein